MPLASLTTSKAKKVCQSPACGEYSAALFRHWRRRVETCREASALMESVATCSKIAFPLTCQIGSLKVDRMYSIHRLTVGRSIVLGNLILLLMTGLVKLVVRHLECFGGVGVLNISGVGWRRAKRRAHWRRRGCLSIDIVGGLSSLIQRFRAESFVATNDSTSASWRRSQWVVVSSGPSGWTS